MTRPGIPPDMVAIKAAELAEMKRELASIKKSLEAREIVIRVLSEDLSRVYRKINHGCTDATCKECDQ